MKPWIISERILKIAGLGLLIWSLGLVWPEINLTLVLGSVVALAVLIGSVALALLCRQHPTTGSTHSGPRQPSRPVVVH